MRVRDYIKPGNRFGRWTVVGEADGGSPAKAACVCDCGQTRDVNVQNLRRGLTQSCGCLQREQVAERTAALGISRTHGQAWPPTPAYESWRGMVQRTTNPNFAGWKYYGGRGITMCDRWSLFENFFTDMGPRPDGLTLDRIDVDGNYEPGNCRWATPTEQVANRRPFGVGS